MSPPSRGPGDRVEFAIPLFPFYSNGTKHNLEHTLEGGVQWPPPRQWHLLSLEPGRCKGVQVGAHREDVKRDPLTEPKQDRPTKTGMIQDMTPR